MRVQLYGLVAKLPVDTLRLGGVAMKPNQVILIAVLVSLATITVHADGVPGDARIIVGHGGGSQPVGQSFLVPVDQNSGGGIDDFKNGSATQNIIELIFTGKLSKKDTITCGSDGVYFGRCTVTPGNGNKVTITFDQPISGGIPPGFDFFVGLNDARNNKGSWKKDGVKDLDGQAVFSPVPTPEPGMLLLLLSGFGSIWLRRKRASSPQTNV